MCRKKLIILGIVFIVLSSFVSADLTTDLEAYYKFDEDTGTTVADSVGANDITVISDWITGKINSGLQIDEGETTGELGLDSYSTWTYNAWIKFINLAKETRFLNRADGNAYLRISSSKVFSFRTPNYGTIYDASSDLDTSNWFMVTFIVNSDDDEVSVYLNGNYKGKNSATTVDELDLDTFSFNMDNSATAGHNVDEAGIWSRALTSTEITELYNSGDGLQYPFNSGDDCDYSGSGDWIIDETCHIDADYTLESGKTLFVTAGNTAFIDSGYEVN